MKKVFENYYLLMFAVFSYVVIYFIDLSLFIESLKSFLDIFLKVFPIILLVFLIIFLTNYFINEKQVAGWFGKKGGIRGWLLSIVLGIISAGPIYAWYPLLADLRDKGMQNKYIAVFLYNRAIKPQLIPLMVLYFGWVFVVVLTFYMIIASVINGLIINKYVEVK